MRESASGICELGILKARVGLKAHAVICRAGYFESARGDLLRRSAHEYMRSAGSWFSMVGSARLKAMSLQLIAYARCTPHAPAENCVLRE